MRHVTLCTTAILAVTTSALAGGASSEDFESYSIGPIAPQSADWDSWDGDPGAAGAAVSTAQANSGTKSLAVQNADDATRVFANITSGVWEVKVMTYVPTAMGGSSFFILLNTYISGDPNKNWSTQVALNNAGGTVEDFDASGSGPHELPLVNNQWVQLRAVINLDTDQQDVYYGGNLLFSDTWTGHASGGGALQMQCIDLWGNLSTGPMFYDDLMIGEVDPIGACCFTDGSCTDGLMQAECDTAGGDYSGIGSTCAAADCPTLGPDGWLRDAPFSWFDDSCDEANDCSVGSGGDIQFVVSVPWQANWKLTLCDSSGNWDSVLAVGTSPCASDKALNDDKCGLLSEITSTNLTPGDWYVTVDGVGSSDCGNVILNMTSGPCAVTPPAGFTNEPETCGTDANGGCNSTPTPLFTALACGQTYYGTAWTNPEAPAGTPARDTDWYEIVLTEETEVTWGGESELNGFVYGLVNTGGSGNCADATALTPVGIVGDPACADASASFTTTLAPGTWWFFAAGPAGGGETVVPCTGVPNGRRYYATLTCTPVKSEPCPWDIDGNGDVGFTDLTAVLANWGPCPGCPADIDGNDDVGFTDLTAILANWGPCP